LGCRGDLRSDFFALVLTLGIGIGVLGVPGVHGAGQRPLGQPKTVLHIVSIQWKRTISEADKERILAGVKEMAAAIPGVRNVWIKSERVEPRGFDDAFVIEFRSRAAADVYASSEAHKKWNEIYLPLRAASVSMDVTNP
jgi:hypothetical protein